MKWTNGKRLEWVSEGQKVIVQRKHVGAVGPYVYGLVCTVILSCGNTCKVYNQERDWTAWRDVQDLHEAVPEE